MSDGKPGRRELTEAVEKLTAEVAALRAERAAHHCCGSACQHAHWHSWTWPVPACAPQPAVWYGTVTTGSGGTGNVSAPGLTSVAAGGVSTYSLALGN